MTEREDFLNRHRAVLFADLLPQLLDVLERLGNFPLPPVRFRHQPGDTPAMSRDDDRRAALDLIEQSRQVGLGLRRLHFTQRVTRIAGPEGGGIFVEALAATLHGDLS